MDNVTIFHGVTIGSDEVKEVETVIGDNVYFGCNVTVLSVSKICSNSKLAAHALVLRDIENPGTIKGLHK